MSNQNTNLTRARSLGNDEFYTRHEDIENELKDYKKHFKGKAVYCNCDDPVPSEFSKFFRRKFEVFGLKELICSCYKNQDETMFSNHTDKHGVVMRYNGNPPRKKKLDGDGDFRSEECVGILTGTDIVVTNPPFSLFREFVAQLIQYKKNFLIIGNINAITYKEIFPLIKENNLWLGVNSVKEFKTPGGGTQKFGNVCWFTNLPHEKRERGSIPLFKKYSRKEYPKYDNYDAINVEKVKDIPCDHYEAMGVPISFLSKYNPQQFDLLDANDIRVNSRVPIKPHGLIKDTEGAVSGKRKYARIVIRRK